MIVTLRISGVVASVCFAGMLQWAGRREAPREEFQAAVARAAPALRGKWQGVLRECLEDGLLVGDGANVEFAHLSFQEYLAAEDLKDPAEGRHLKILHEFLLGDDRWREVMSFYVGMTNHPDEVAAWIRAVNPLRMFENKVNSDDVAARKQFLLRSIADTSPGWLIPQF